MHVEVSVAFLDDVCSGVFEIIDLMDQDHRRVRDLCRQYADSAIGLVDAAVLTIAERLNGNKVAILDHRNFRMFRPRHTDALILVPE
jgi:uncharacterized protein